MLFQYQFRRPPNLVGELVLLQWYYVASNSGCIHEGYDTYPWPQEWIKDVMEDGETGEFDEMLSVGVGLDKCEDVLPADGNG